MLSRTAIRLLLLLAVMMLAACSDDDDNSPAEDRAIVSSYKVAVVMPANQQKRWSRTVDWALENIAKAQAGMEERIAIEVEWKDENAADLDTYLKTIASDNQYVAIVGPLASTNARHAMIACNSYEKTLMLPVVTSTELQRVGATKDFVWNLVQSDITQCDILLTQAKLSDVKSVSLLTSDDDYGKSFADWFAYQAVEVGLKVDFVSVHSNENELREAMRKEQSQKRNYNRALIFAPGRESDALVFDDEYKKMQGDQYYLDFPMVLCSDVVSSPLLAGSLKSIVYEGVSPTADPSSGFVSAYHSRFGENPSVGEPQLFDAIYMLAYGLTAKQEQETLNDALRRVMQGRDSWHGSWLPANMRQALEMIKAGGAPNLCGTIGDWTFDENTHTNILNTIYNHWLLIDGKYTTIEYLSSDGSLRTISTTSAWDWEQKHLQSFDQSAIDFSYPELKDRWAVVVSTSDSWTDYRHEADALAMYQLLKRHGYDDSHIILLIADKMAYNENNPNKGVVRVRPDGENLYHDVTIDYKLGNCSLDDLKQIMLGQQSEALPEVLGSSANDNVIVFWCGHGSKNQLMWGAKDVVEGSKIREIIEQMSNEHKFRKMLFVMDACYSGSIGKACEGIPGVLMITAANPYEPSKADIFDNQMNIWLSNGFTRAFQETIDKNTDINLRELYYELARHTTGSHATVYNAAMYGNMYRQTMAEWLE